MCEIPLIFQWFIFPFPKVDCLGYYLCFLRLFRDKQEDSFLIQWGCYEALIISRFFLNRFLELFIYLTNNLQLDALSCEIKSDTLSRKLVILGGLSLCFEEKKKIPFQCASGGYFFRFFFPRKTKKTKRQNLFIECHWRSNALSNFTKLIV